MPRTPRRSFPFQGYGFDLDFDTAWLRAKTGARPLAVALSLGLNLGIGFGQTGRESAAQVPGPEVFAKTPTTPMELWDAIDYLVRTQQARKAVPYIEKFLASKPDDASLIRIRDTFGFKSILQLEDDPSTKKNAEPILKMVLDAAKRVSTDPERIKKAIPLLTLSPSEQAVGLDRLRHAGASAVPFLIDTLKAGDLSSEDRVKILKSLQKLDSSAVPALIPALDAANIKFATEMAGLIGSLGDRDAVPWLTIKAAVPGTPGPLASSSAEAIRRLTGKKFAGQPKVPVDYLIDEAHKYQLHKIVFDSDPALVWTWDADAQNVVAKPLAISDAEALLGGKLANAALAIDPKSNRAKAALLSLELEKAIEKSGFDGFAANDPSGAFDKVVKSGPVTVAILLQNAIADRQYDLAAFAAKAFGTIVKENPGMPIIPLMRAINAPGRRARFAAVKAIVDLDLKEPFPGSSRIVPTLAQFVNNGPLPRVVVIDGNAARGSQVVSFFKTLGYDPILSTTGRDGFRDAAETADIELITIEVSMIGEGWRLHDTVANLRNDARTAGVPICLIGPLSFQAKLEILQERFPETKMIVTPVNADGLATQLAFGNGLPQPLSKDERSAYAKEATALLAKIAATPNSPYVSDLPAIEPTLMIALNAPDTKRSAADALGYIAEPNAQRDLAKLVVDPSEADDVRLAAAGLLAKSIRHFGPLIDASQEVKVVEISNSLEPQSKLKTALIEIIDALTPSPRLRAVPPLDAGVGNAK